MDSVVELRARAEPLVGSELADHIARWFDEDPDPVTREELVELVADGASDELADRFGRRIGFGTAGLRGRMGVGPNRMNRLVVRHAAAGLMRYLPSGATVAIGFDARHGSQAFAEETARVVAAAGGQAVLLPGPNPTPLVPFAVRHLGADAGVMVTASHNPAPDNGYKVYLAGGAQLVAPSDAEIAALIAEASTEPVPRATADDSAISSAGPEVTEAFLAMVDRCRLVPDSPGVATVYTPLHGVGAELLLAAFDRAGFPPPAVVAEQAEPDPDFPTTPFPNPEEPGTFDLAFDLADRERPELVLAHDSDADRLGAAIPDGDGWRMLTGNEIGVLLGDHILRHTTGGDRLVVTTIVSSRMLGRMAAAAGVRYAATLTGFKWIVRPGLDDPAARFVFGYEEALGYLVTDELLDKDGISASVLLVEAAGVLAATGRTLADRLDELAVEHGLHHSETWSVRFTGLDARDRMREVMSQLRSNPPTELAGMAVSGFHDYAQGGDLPPTDAVALEMGDQARVLARPSNTEPKIKLYLEVVLATTAETLQADRADASELLEDLRAGLAGHLHLDSG